MEWISAYVIRGRPTLGSALFQDTSSQGPKGYRSCPCHPSQEKSFETSLPRSKWNIPRLFVCFLLDIISPCLQNGSENTRKWGGKTFTGILLKLQGKNEDESPQEWDYCLRNNYQCRRWGVSPTISSIISGPCFLSLWRHSLQWFEETSETCLVTSQASWRRWASCQKLDSQEKGSTGALLLRHWVSRGVSNCSQTLSCLSFSTS